MADSNTDTEESIEENIVGVETSTQNTIVLQPPIIHCQTPITTNVDTRKGIEETKIPGVVRTRKKSGN